MTTSPPPVDPARQQTIGLMLLLLLWLGYCTYLSVQHQQQQPEDDETEDVSDLEEDDPRVPDDTPPPTTDPDDPEETEPEPVEPDDPVDPEEPVDPEDPQTQPATQPGTQVPEPTYADVREWALPEDETPATPLMRPVFSEVGGGLSDLYIIDYQGFTGRDHRKRANVGDTAHILRPYRPWQLHFTADLHLRTEAGPVELGTGFLQRVRWEHVESKTFDLDEVEVEPVRFVVGGEKEPPEKRYEVTFRYPPANGEDVPSQWPEGFVVYRTFAYTDATYLIDVNYRFVNHGPRTVEVRSTSRLNGPVGMNTSFFKPDETDALFIRRGDQPPTLYLHRTGREEADSETLGRGYREIGLNSIFRRGFEVSEAPAYRYLRVSLPRTEGNAVEWIGHTVRFMATATFAPRGLDLGENDAQDEANALDDDGLPVDQPRLWAPRVVEATVVPFRNPTRQVMPEVDEQHQVLDGVPAWQRWLLSTSMRIEGFQVEPGQTRGFQVRAYTGPTEPAHMEAAGLGEAVHYSYSWVEWLAIPLIAILEFFHGIFGNWGIAIILLTLMVRFLLFPISWKSQFKMQEGAALMQLVQPDLEKLRKKYANNKQKMQQEQMKLFRERGIPMTGMLQGCLLMLLQMPIWIALFGAFRYYIGFYGADFLWINDLTSPDALITIGEFRLPYLPLLEVFGLLGGQMTPSGVFHINILPIAVMFTMWYQMRFAQKQQTMTMDPDQLRTQKMMMGCMFIFFFFLFYTMPAGFNLYFLATTGYGLVETRILKPRIKEQIEKSHPGIYDKIEANKEKARQEKEREAKRMQAKAAKA